MKGIKNVKLGFNKNAEVTVIADIEMKDDNDVDSLFLCFFTLLSDPLRLSVVTTGCLNDHLATILNQPVANIEKLMRDNGELYAAMIQQNTENLLQFGEEQNKVILDSAKSAENASGLLASMIKNGYYIQKMKYHFPNEPTAKQEQKVDISPLKPAFKQMLEICKRWDDPQLQEGIA
tara:strand:- start:1883 stop:2413 length:531 start_codon:yes stop_codon:yes gene_type:complete